MTMENDLSRQLPPFFETFLEKITLIFMFWQGF